MLCFYTTEKSGQMLPIRTRASLAPRRYSVCPLTSMHDTLKNLNITYRSAAGGLTTSIILNWWLLAMLAFPEVQVRAHAELDQVVGRTRAPTFADLPSLPYIRAMVQEVLRWSPPLPFGIPHASSADDWYEGKFIPKGTIILPNMRVINSNPAVFGVDSARFNPARHLDEKGEVKVKGGHEEGHVTFGYGRRLCPGRFVAEGTLAIDFATLLWALRFERPEGAQGELDVHTLVRIGIGACVFLLLRSWLRIDVTY